MSSILIVEDSPTQAEQLRMILEAEGFAAEVATSGEAALFRLRSERFSLVLSDIVMPGMSGYELCRAIKSETSLRDTPVILLTTRKDPMDIFLGLECGADNFFTKPYEADRLIDRIRQILQNRVLRSGSKLKLGVEIAFFGKIITINSEKEQILDLLISAFEDTVQMNRQLEKSRDELAKANLKVEEYARRLEGRVRSSEEWYRAIFEGISDGILSIDEDGVIDTINPAAEAMFGYSSEEIVGSNLDILATDPRQNLIDQFVQAQARKAAGKFAEGGPLEIEVRRKDGTILPVALSVGQIDVGARHARIAAVRDLSVERASEAQLRQAQKMEAVGQLTGGIAHDFNNLLTVILGNSELLVERLEDDEEFRSLAEMVRTAAERGSALTNRLLAFARRQALDPKPVDVNKLVSGMDGLLRRTLGVNIEIETVYQARLWEAMVDAAQLESAILNLGINARDAMPDGGRLTIETSNVRLDQDYADSNIEIAPGQYTMVAVSDTGTGMAPDVLARAFDPFFTTKDVGKGSGLGLSMIYGFVKQSKGHVKIYSEIGQGTTVKLYLPRAIGEVSRPSQPARSAAMFGGTEKILLVEDDDLVRDHVNAQLKSFGYKVITTNNGTKALAILRQVRDIDLLFTDIVMPGGLNGRELADAARKLRPDMPILFTSGYTENAIVHHGRLDPGVHLLAKPYRREDLALKLRRVLDEEAQGHAEPNETPDP